MSKISRYFIQPGVNFVDFSLDLQPDASLQGQTVVLRGSSLVDRVYVGHGLSVDFTASLGNTDLIFVAGTRADFTASLSGINLRLTHKSSPGTQITLGTGDHRHIVRMGQFSRPRYVCATGRRAVAHSPELCTGDCCH